MIATVKFHNQQQPSQQHTTTVRCSRMMRQQDVMLVSVAVVVFMATLSLAYPAGEPPPSRDLDLDTADKDLYPGYSDDSDFTASNNVPQPPLLLVGPPPHVIFGKPIALHCQASGRDVRYDWYNGSQLECGNCDPSRTYRTEGWYQCRAVNQFGVAVSNKTHYQTAKLVHLAPPVAVGLPTYTFHARQGGGVVLPCNATLSVPRSASLYRWLQICEGRHGRTSEREVGVDDSNSDFIITDDGGLLVTNVDAATANPRCNYRCRVWNDIMRESQYYDVHLSATERIDTGGSSVVVYASEKTVVMAGQAASLYCFFYSRRQVYWSLANGRPLSSKITFSHDGQVLRIVDADASHSGLYRCTDGMSSVEIQLLVEGPPIITQKPITQKTCDNSATFSCSADGHPRPRINWLLNDRPVKDIYGVEVYAHNRSSSRLVLQALSNHFSAVIHCVAINRHGTRLAAAHVIVAEEFCTTMPSPTTTAAPTTTTIITTTTTTSTAAITTVTVTTTAAMSTQSASTYRMTSEASSTSIPTTATSIPSSQPLPTSTRSYLMEVTAGSSSRLPLSTVVTTILGSGSQSTNQRQTDDTARAVERTTVANDEELFVAVNAGLGLVSHVRWVLVDIILPVLATVALLGTLVAICVFTVRMCRRPATTPPPHPNVSYSRASVGKCKSAEVVRVLLPPTAAQAAIPDDDPESDNDSGLGDA